MKTLIVRTTPKKTYTVTIVDCFEVVKEKIKRFKVLETGKAYANQRTAINKALDYLDNLSLTKEERLVKIKKKKIRKIAERALGFNKSLKELEKEIRACVKHEAPCTNLIKRKEDHLFELDRMYAMIGTNDIEKIKLIAKNKKIKVKEDEKVTKNNRGKN